MTIKEIAEHAYNTAEMHGHYGNNPEQAIIDKLEEEVGELDNAFYCNDFKPFPMLPKDNDKFKQVYEEYIKDTVPGELCDIIVTACAAAKKYEIHLELFIPAVLRYNKLRTYHVSL